MDRREFLITSGAAVAAASSTAAHAEGALPASADGQLGDGAPLRLAMPWADAPQEPADSAQRLARRIETLTGGRYRFVVVAGATQSTQSDADLVHGPVHAFSKLHPAFAYFGGLPGSGGLSAQDLAHWIAVGGGQMLWDDLAGRHGWKPLLAGHSGEAPPLWSRHPINNLADLSGLRVATPGLGADTARALGAEAHDAPTPHDAAAALADGSILAAEAGGLMTSLASGIAASAAHATGQGFNGHGAAFALSIRLSVWERLPEEDRAIFGAAAAEEFQISLAEQRAHAGLARRVLETSRGVRFAPWPDDISEALDRVAEATIAHVAGQDDLALRIDQSYMAFRGLISGMSAPRRSPAMA